VLALAFWAGCSVERDYQTLSLFFDGVPDPHAKATTQDSASAELSRLGPAMKQSKPIASTHKPFAEEKCTACHTRPTEVFASALDSNLCVKCHEKVLDAYPSMHGAVVGRACLFCHEPHDSSYASLLKTNAPDLCVQCHERVALTPRVDAHALEGISCLDCHTGHGGDKPPFLRATPLRTAPPAADGGVNAK
jgi:predicted CXXCH cytochrome family protein